MDRPAECAYEQLEIVGNRRFDPNRDETTSDIEGLKASSQVVDHGLGQRQASPTPREMGSGSITLKPRRCSLLSASSSSSTLARNAPCFWMKFRTKKLRPEFVRECKPFIPRARGALGVPRLVMLELRHGTASDTVSHGATRQNRRAQLPPKGICFHGLGEMAVCSQDARNLDLRSLIERATLRRCGPIARAKRI